jgi:hypothetical protein
LLKRGQAKILLFMSKKNFFSVLLFPVLACNSPQGKAPTKPDILINVPKAVEPATKKAAATVEPLPQTKKVEEPAKPVQTMYAKKLEGPYPPDGAGYFGELTTRPGGDKMTCAIEQKESPGNVYTGPWEARNPKTPPESFPSANIFVTYEVAKRGGNPNIMGLYLEIYVEEGAYGLALDAPLLLLPKKAKGGFEGKVVGTSMKFEDLIPGGDPELLFQYKSIFTYVSESGESNVSVMESLLICGVGASKVPSCLEPIPLSGAYWYNTDQEKDRRDPPATGVSTFKLEYSFSKEGQLTIEKIERHKEEIQTADSFNPRERAPKPETETETSTMAFAISKAKVLIGIYMLSFP